MAWKLQGTDCVQMNNKFRCLSIVKLKRFFLFIYSWILEGIYSNESQIPFFIYR